MTKFPIDREVLEDLRSDRALSDAADEIAGALEGLRDDLLTTNDLLMILKSTARITLKQSHPTS